MLVGYGEGIVETLAFFMRDEDEDIWVRRHIPSTLALIPTQQSVDVLLSALDAPDGFLRYKALRALGRLKREHPELAIPTAPIEALVVKETNRYFSYLGPPLQRGRQGPGRQRHAAGARARREARPHGGPHLLPARDDLPVEGRRRGAVDARARDAAARAPAPSSTWTTC